MKRVKLLATAMVLAVLAVMAGQVTAQQTNTTERTFLTFSSAVEMPGVSLKPGTYVFKLADTPTRNVVQVWDQDEKNMIGHWTFVQAERPQVTEETVVMFRETAEGTTPAVQYWYFPGEKVGKEFIYPKDQAERIAARTGAKVRTEEGVVEAGAVAAASPAPAQPAPAAEPEPAPAPAVAEAPAPAPAAEPEPAPAPAVAEAPAPAPEPAPAPVEESRVAQAQPEPRPVGTAGQAAAELPATASPLAFSGLLGLLSLAGAAGIRFFRG
jgi:hypothetical protein